MRKTDLGFPLRPLRRLLGSFGRVQRGSWFSLGPPFRFPLGVFGRFLGALFACALRLHIPSRAVLCKTRLPTSRVFLFVVDLVSEAFLFGPDFGRLDFFCRRRDNFGAVGGVRLRRTILQTVLGSILRFLGGGWKPKVKMSN